MKGRGVSASASACGGRREHYISFFTEINGISSAIEYNIQSVFLVNTGKKMIFENTRKIF